MRRVLIPSILLAAVLAVVTAPRAVLAQEEAVVAPDGAAAPGDPYLWLEEVEGDRAMRWVEEQSQATLEALRQHPAFEPIFQETLEILSSDARIAYPSIRGDRLYNFWQDEEHERGIWRRTTWQEYLAGDPEWEVVLDLDALAEAEGVPWSFGGASCREQEHQRCMVRLSRGGSDAVEMREFDLGTAEFVPDGFHLPESKSSVTWVGRDTLLVATAIGEGSLTTSGYPRVVKRWARGTELAEAATIFEADRRDVAAWVGAVETGDAVYPVIQHRPSFFRGTVHIVDGRELTAVNVPMDADPTIFGDQLVVYLRSDWEVGGAMYPGGSIIAMELRRFLDGERDFDVVAKPGPRRTVQPPTAAKSYLLVTVLDDVREQLWRYRRVDGEWVGERIEAGDFGSVGIAARDVHTDRFFFTYASFTQPTTLYLAEGDGDVREVRRSPEWFVADGIEVDQYWATSADGTEVPYFIVRPVGMERDGRNPTLLTAYGGFQVSRTPYYSGTVGRAWLERGGVYVLANIRGGGEFGPDWWRAALKENRQRAYDDFLAVAEDLIARDVTTPDHLGIRGGSNGGLLVGVAMTQRPDLFDAVVSAVPLLDMRRYNKLLAGASWMAEYGNPDEPEEWAYIREYSPYHNIHEDTEYPRPLIYTTTRDDRVHPGHARKMARKMMDLGHEVFYWENTEGGHGSGITPEQRARQTAITYAYLWMQLGDGETSGD